MSRQRALFSCIRSIQTILCRSYVASRAEVREYVHGRKAALKWLEGFEQRSRKRHITDHFAIHDALKYHLKDPVQLLRHGETELRPEYSLAVLDTCRSLLTDLEPYMTAKNIVRCAERTANVLSYSEREIWKHQHEDCLIRLTEMILLSIPRCDRSELGLLIWSYGKWGPDALKLKVNADTTIEDVVMRLMERLMDNGVKGELDNPTISNVLNGCVQLRLQPTQALLTGIREKFKGSIEFAEPRSLTRLIVSFSQLGLNIGSIARRRLGDTLEAKIAAGNYPEMEMPVMLWALGRWGRGNPKSFNRVAESLIRQTMEWGLPQWTMHQCGLILTGCIDLRYFPSWSFLERMSLHLQSLDCEARGIWGMLLMAFAELGIRPAFVIQKCKTLMMQPDTMGIPVFCSMLRSLTVMNDISIDDFQKAVSFLQSRVLDMTPHHRSSMYQAFLHVKYFHGWTNIDDPASLEFLDLCREAWRQRERFLNHRRRILAKAKKQKYQSIEMADEDLIILTPKGDALSIIDPEQDVFLNIKGRITGSQLWRQRLLLKFGCRVAKPSTAKPLIHERVIPKPRQDMTNENHKRVCLNEQSPTDSMDDAKDVPCASGFDDM